MFTVRSKNEEPTSSEVSGPPIRLIVLIGGGYVAVVYAAVLSGYSFYYRALDLNMSSVTLTRDQLLNTPFSVAFVFGTLGAVVLLSAMAGLESGVGFRERQHPVGMYVLAIFILFLTATTWHNAPTFAPLMAFCHLIGIFVAMMSTGFAARPNRELQQVVALLAAWTAFTVVTSMGVLMRPPYQAWLLVPQVAVIAGSILAFRRLSRRGDSCLWFGNPSASVRRGLREISVRRRWKDAGGYGAWLAASLAVLTVVVISVALWDRHMWRRGSEAAYLGYTTESVWETLNPEGVRPVTLGLVDPEVDPLGLCGDTAYAASLIEPRTDERWLMLRIVEGDQVIGYQIVELPASAYTVWKEPTPEPRSGETESVWNTDACRDRP